MKLTPMIVLAALSVGTAAFAQTPPPGGGPAPTPEMQAARKAMMEACATDRQTLCADKQGREAMMCMRDNADKLSPPCKDAMSKMRAARQAAPTQ
jgi:hypothetical protein